MSVSFGDLKVRMGMDSSALDAGASRAIQKLRSIGQGLKDPTIGLDHRAFDRQSAAVTKTLQDIARRETTAHVTADTSTAQGQAEALKGVLGSITDARYVAQVAVDTERAYQELLDLQTLFSRMDQTEEVIKVRADVDEALRDIGRFRQELEEVEGTSVGLSTRLAGLGGTLGSIGKTALGVAGGIGLANAASNLLGSAFNFVTDAVIGANVELENARAKILAFTNDGAAADAILADIREEAEKTPFAFQEMADAVGGLIPTARQANEPLMDLVRTAEILAASNPAEGLAGAAFALREAVSGDFTSIIERFNLPRQYINKLKEEGVPALEIVRSAMQEMGYDITLVSNLSQTASGKWSTFMDTLREAGRRIGEPIFLQLKEGLDGLIAFTETQAFDDMVVDWTARVDSFAGALARFVREDGPEVIATLQQIGEVALIMGQMIGSAAGFILEVKAAWDQLPEPIKRAATILAGTIDMSTELVGVLRLLKAEAPEAFSAFEQAVAQGYINTQNMTVAVDQQGSVLKKAASVASDYFGVMVTGQDIARGYIVTQDGVVHSTDRFIEAVVNGTTELLLASKAADTASNAVRVYGNVEDQASARREAAAESLRRQNMDTLDYVSSLNHTQQAIYAVSEALSTLNVIMDNNARAQSQVNGVIDVFQSQGAQYTAELNSMEEAHAALIERQRLGLELSDDQLLFLENYGSAHERVEGAIADAAIQEGLAAAAKVELWRAQEELNAAVDRGETDLTGYNDRLQKAQDYLSDVDPASGAAQAIETLSLSINSLVPLFQDMINALRGVDEVDPEVTLTDNATPILDDIIASGQDFDSASYSGTLAAESTPFDDTMDGANSTLGTFEQKTTTTSVAADPTPFNETIGVVEGRLTEFGAAEEDATLQADKTPFDASLDGANDRLATFDGTTATATVSADVSAAESELNRIIGLIAQINSSNVGPTNSQGTNTGMFAEGGFVNEPTLALIGEAGPELVLPLSKPARMQALMAQAGIPAWADGGGAGFDIASTSPKGGPAFGDVTLDVRVNIEPIDWGFLFAGLDREAEDWGEQAGKKFIGFFKGNITDLATGDMLADARAELEDLFTIRQIAIDSGAPAEVIAQIDAEIQAQSETVNAIGASMGTDVVKGIADSLASGEAAQLLSEFREGVFDGLDLSGAGVLNLEDSIAQMTALRDAALEMGDQAQADKLTAQIAELNGELTLTNQILETDAVQAWQANEEAAAAAAAEAKAYADAAASVADPGALQQKLEAARDAELALQIAMADGADPATIAEMQAKYDAAVAAVIDFEDALRTAVDAGLLTEEELMAHAQQGGQALQTILQSGVLSEEQIRELVESGDEAVREILDAFFGENTVAAWEEGWQAIGETDFAKLLEMEPKGEDMSAQWVSGVLQGLENGRLSITQAMELITDDAGNINDQAAQSLLDTWRQIDADLQEAMATGENLEATQAAYDQFMAFLEQLALASGMTVEEIKAHFESLEAAALQTESTLQGVSFSVGGSASAGASAYDKLTEAIREFDEAQRDAAAEPIWAEYDAGLITIEEARAKLEALGKELDNVARSTEEANGAAERYQRTVERFSNWNTALWNFHIVDRYGESIDDNIARLQEAFELDPEGFSDSFISAYEAALQNAQKALLSGQLGWIDSTKATLERMRTLAAMLGIDIGKALTDGIDEALLDSQKSPLRGDYIKDLKTGILRIATQQEREQYEQGKASGKAFGNGVADGVRESLDIHSPSRVLMDLAGDAVDGWQIRWEERMRGWDTEAVPLPDVSEISRRVAGFTRGVSQYLSPAMPRLDGLDQMARQWFGELSAEIANHITLEVDGEVLAGVVNRSNARGRRLMTGLVRT